MVATEVNAKDFTKFIEVTLNFQDQKIDDFIAVLKDLEWLINPSKAKIRPESSMVKVGIENLEIQLERQSYLVEHKIDQMVSGNILLRYKDGSRYEGMVLNQKKHGIGKYVNKYGHEYIGNFVADHFEGEGSFNDNNGKSYKGNWRMNKKHGYGQQ